MKTVLIFAGALVAIWPSLSRADSPALLATITGTGVEIPSLGATPIRPPALGADQTASARAAALKAIAGGAGWKRFSRNSVVAPVSIDMEYLKDAGGNRIGHRVHVAFVVHASLETLKDKDLMKQMFGDDEPDDQGEAKEPSTISDEELAQMGIRKEDQTSFASVEFPLLDKVLARGVLQIQQQTHDDTIVLAIELDPRFKQQNGWKPINDKTESAASQWRPYEGAAGYLSVTRLNETDGEGLSTACLMQSRFVVYEPTDWFSGSNLLRSKIPLMLQESARSLRRKLK